MSPTSHQQVSPQRILSTLQAYRDAAALNTAIELELFTRIAHGADTPGKIAADLAVPVHGIRVLCNYLAAAGLILKDGEEMQLTADSAAFLDKASPTYFGHAADLLYSTSLRRRFDQLTDFVCGRETPAASQEGPEWFDIARGLTDRKAAVSAFVDALPLPGGPLKILHVGAGDGQHGIEVASRYPQAIVVAVDRPAALRTAQQNAMQAGLGTRYQTIPGDLACESFGYNFDAAIIAERYNQVDPSGVELSMKRIADALKKNGRLFILEFLADDTDAHAGFALNLLAATRRGTVYLFAELKQKLQQSGFNNVESRPIAAARATLITATSQKAYQ